MNPAKIASTFSRELLKDAGASGVNAFLGQCAKEGVGRVVADLIVTGGTAARGTLNRAAINTPGASRWLLIQCLTPTALNTRSSTTP